MPTRPAIPLLLALALPGCGYRDAATDFRAAYAAGDRGEALDIAAQQEQWGPSRHELVWRLERGKLLLEAGQIAEARVELAKAEAKLDAFDRQPETSLSAGMTTTMWNALATTYRGRLSDRILLHTLSSIAALAEGDMTEAQVQRRKAFVAQQDAVQRHARAIEQASRHDRASDATALLGDPAIAGDIERARAAVGPAYAGYTNPWTTYLAALLMAAEGDASNARVELARVAAMVPDNAAVQRDLETDAWLDDPAPGVVYIFLEAGLSPERRQVSVPYFTPWGGAGSVAMPVLRFQPKRIDGLTASFVNTAAYPTAGEPLASLDAVVAADYDAELPIITLRAIMSLAVKEGATITSAQLSDDSNGWWILLLGSLWKLASAEADTRGWSSLGQGVYLARLTRDRGASTLALGVDALGRRGASMTLSLPDTRAVLVYARSVTGADLTAVAMSLTKEPMR